MIRNIALFPVWVVILAASAPGMEKGFSWTYAPAGGETEKADISVYSLGKYLAECQVNRPEIAAEIKALLARGEYYRKRTRDQKGVGTLLTAYVDRDLILHVITHRSETCPDCKGTGTRARPFDNLSKHVAVRFRCLKCNGEGRIPNTTTEKLFTLSPEDYEDSQAARALYQQRAFANAPAQAERWVERLASPDPRERLAACEWLDAHYVREGVFFQDIMPMLRKARYHETSEKKKMLVWQFWAGKDLANAGKKAYYRIFADAKSGKVVKKEFASGR